MSLPILNFIGLIISIGVFVFGMALVLITLWQNRYARTNQYLALTMLGLSLWAIPNALFYVEPFYDEFNLDLNRNIGTTFYTLALFALFFFMTELEDPNERRIARHTRYFAVLDLILVLVVTWTNNFWTTSELNEAGNSYEFRVTFLASIIFAVIAIIFFYIGMMLRQSSLAKRPALLRSILPLPIGLVFLSLLGAPIGHVIHVGFVLLTIMMLARVVLRDQLFNPLVEMFNELTVKNAQLEESSRHKSEFLANMSHELRTPLNSIIGYSELVLQGIYGSLEERQYDRLQKVHRNGKELLVLINDVLDLSKIDAGRLDLSPTYISPQPLIDEVIKTLNDLATEKGQTLTRQYQNLPLLFVDEIRARQVILNGLANMIKFTAENKPIQIGGYFDAARNQVILNIRASSGGITSSDAVKINQALAEDDELPSAQFADFGLGLAVSRRLVELHGGRIWFDKINSTFHIAFPSATEPGKRATALIQPVDKIDKAKPVILIIDDDIEAIEVVQGYLEPAGFQVFGAASGHEGILRTRELKPDAILLDMRMPGLDGWGVLDILEADQTLQDIPVIMISVIDQSHLISQVGRVVASLSKPLHRSQLISTLERILPMQKAT